MAKAKSKARRGFSIAPRTSAPVVVVKAPTRRRRASAAIRRIAGGARRVAKRGMSLAAQRDLEMAATVGAVGLGVAEQEGDDGAPRVDLSKVSFGGIDPALIIGGALVAGPSVMPKMFGGKWGKRASFAGLGVWCAGVARSVARKSAKVSGEDDE